MATTTSWPDATNTGVLTGTHLVNATSNDITTPGVYSGLIFTGTVNIQCSNVTLQNCLIKDTNSDWTGVYVSGGLKNVVIQNCDIAGAGVNTSVTGTYGVCVTGDSQVSIYNNNVHDVGSPFALAAGQVVIEGNYAHSFYSGPGTHYNGMQVNGGNGADFSLLMKNNSIINNQNQTDAIMIDNEMGPINNIAITDNLLVGGAYTVYVDSSKGSFPTTNVNISNNHIGAGIYGDWYLEKGGLSSANYQVTTSGNVNDGAALAATLNTSANGGGTTTSTGGTTTSTGGTTADAGGTTTGSTGSTGPAAPVDTKAPSAPTLVSDTTVDTNHVQLHGTAGADSTVTVYDGTNVVGTGKTDASGAWSVTTAALSDGAHSLTATATDAAGNVSPVSKPLDPVIGTTQPDPGSTPPDPGSPPPDTPTISSLSNDREAAGDHITNDNAPTLTGTAVADSTVDVFDGTEKIGTTTADSNGQWSLTASELSDGSHSLTATDTDASGHTSAASEAFSITIDTHEPDAPTMMSYSHGGAAVGSTTTLHDLVLNGTAEANSKIDIFDGEKAIGTAATSDSGTWSFEAGHLANGSHSFTSTATDAAGTTSAASEAEEVTVTEPESTVGFTSVSENSSHVATIKGTTDAHSQVKLYEGSTSLGTVKAADDGSWSFTTGHLSNKVHVFTAQEVDGSGQTIAKSSGEAILGSTGSDKLTSTAGNDLFVGNGHPDTFVFAPNFGHDVIMDFTAKGPGHDVVQFSKSVFDNFADVLAHATQSGPSVVIADSAGDSLTLKNTKLADLHKMDFHFA